MQKIVQQLEKRLLDQLPPLSKMKLNLQTSSSGSSSDSDYGNVGGGWFGKGGKHLTFWSRGNDNAGVRCGGLAFCKQEQVAVADLPRLVAPTSREDDAVDVFSECSRDCGWCSGAADMSS